MAQILVIDDDPAIQILLKRTLSRQGYQVVTANNGEEGLAKALELRPAMVVCDWLMPRMNGLEVCRQVKATPSLSTTFFILLTSLGSVEDRVKGLDAGADDFLCKPIEMYELKARVRAGLRLHELSRDLQQQKQLLEAELAEAAEYVCSILPEPIAEPSTTIDVRFIPSRRLGGDGFDYYWLDSEHLAIYLLDVAGHGLRAALPSLSVLNLLRSRFNRFNQVNLYQPSEVLQELNQIFQMTPRNDRYFTIWYGVYHTRQRRLIYASAGHPPAILFSPDPQGGTIKQILKTPGFPVGMFPSADYVDAHCQIHPDSSLYIFSDGIYEFDLSNGSIWGLDNFIELLNTTYQQGQHSLDLLLKQIYKLNSKMDFDDDLSIIQIQLH
ncbi:MAG: PP2C family protein-serine/threonine phosphatase [Cyanophyceae cyanobacterium]